MYYNEGGTHWAPRQAWGDLTARVGGANWDPHEPEGVDNLERSYGVHDTPWGPRSLTLLLAAMARALGVDAGSACIPPHD